MTLIEAVQSTIHRLHTASPQRQAVERRHRTELDASSGPLGVVSPLDR